MELIQREVIQDLENGLNSIQNDLDFKFFLALGDYIEAYRVNNSVIDYVQGIARFLPTTLLPIPNVNMFQTTAEIEIAISIDSADVDDEGNYNLFNKVISIINSFAQQKQAQAYFKEIDNKNYQIIPLFTLPTNDAVVMNTSDLGEIIPINFSVEFIITENLVNSNSYKLYIDEKEINFETLTLSRIRVADQYSIKGLANTESAVLQNGLSIDLTLPQFLSEECDNLVNDLFDGDNNEAHYVRIEVPTVVGNKIYNYIMIYGNTQGTIQRSSNVGINLSLVQGVQNVLNYSAEWVEEICNGDTISFSTDGPACYFWGDGSSDYITEGNITHSYNQEGSYVIRIFKSNGLQSYTWEEISQISINGLATEYFKIGDCKTIQLTTGEDVEVLILGFNHDNLADGTGKAGITFGMKNLLSTTYAINTENLDYRANTLAWRNCSFRINDIPNIINTLPQEIINVIKEVNKNTLKTVSPLDPTIPYGEVDTTADKLWLLSGDELRGEIYGGTFGQEGDQYSYFSNSPSFIKYLSNGSGDPYGWWLRTVHSNTAPTNNYKNISASGTFSSSGTMSTDLLGISLCFCV